MPHYKLTSPNGKSYHGITTLTVNRRMTGHKTAARNGSKYPLHAAIRKYGFDSFKLEVLSESKDLSELHALEVAAIARDNTLSPHGYNLTAGGEGTTGHAVSDEHKKAIGERMTERWKDPVFAEMKRKNSSETAARLVALPGHKERFIAGSKAHWSKPENIAARTKRVAELRVAEPDRFKNQSRALVAYNTSERGKFKSSETAKALRASQSPERRTEIAMLAAKKRAENKAAREDYLASLPPERVAEIRAAASAKKSLETAAGRARATPEQKEASRERYRQAALRRHAAKKAGV